jgi:plasmid stabilization system protein ParE
MEIRFLAVAQQEFDEAVEYYNAESPGLGDQFLLDALDALERVRQFPRAWHPYTENSRRCQTRRFPYGIVYQVLESEILVVAVAHMHRKPGYWLDRISEKK